MQTNPATGEPAVFRTLICDKATAYTAAQAITAALFARERGAAEGQHIELAMLDAGIAFLWPDAAMDRALLEDDTARQPTIGANYQVTKLAGRLHRGVGHLRLGVRGLLRRARPARDRRRTRASARSPSAWPTSPTC